MKKFTLNDYQDAALKTDILNKPQEGTIEIPLLGLFGEAGSLLSALKKHRRDDDSFHHYQGIVFEEVGDCLWYLANICSRLGRKLGGLGETIARKQFNLDHEQSIDEPTFQQLQSLAVAAKMLGKSSPSYDVLVHLGSTAGKLLALQEDGSSNEDIFEETLLEMLWVLAQAAAETEISFQHAAEENLQKNLSRWPVEKTYLPLFDEDEKDEERLPRERRIEFFERTVNGKSYVIQQCNGINIGDRLTDNSLDPDDYRFHDVFHLAYAVHLGWSPVMRALFKVKRKNSPRLDEVQDGARAIIIEEAISAWIFSKSKPRFFEGAKSVDFSILKMARDFGTGYEVQRCPLWQWEAAILAGFDMFRQLQEHRKGAIEMNVTERTLRFKPL